MDLIEWGLFRLLLLLLLLFFCVFVVDRLLFLHVRP